MTTEDKTGGYAFAAGASNESHAWIQEGMTLRDWFAGMALQGMAADGAMNGTPVAPLVQTAYVAADAMIAERNKQRNGE